MASLHITGFEGVAVGTAGAIPIPQGITEHQELSIATQVDSAAFAATTRIVRLWAEAACHVSWGAAEQAATTAMMPIGAGESIFISVNPSDEISVIAA